MRKTTLGRIIQENREKQQFSKKEVCRGLCSVMALSRYEMDERVPDKFLLDALLERLGLNPFRYEFVASDQEFYYSVKRDQIEKIMYEENREEAWNALKEYESHIQAKDKLHWQYLLLKKGSLLEKEKKYNEAIAKFKKALEYTKSNEINIGKQKDIMLTNIEIELFYLLGKIQYLKGNKKEAVAYFRMLKEYMEQRKTSQDKWKEYYPYILYCLAQYEFDFHNLGKSYEYVKQAEKVLLESYQFKGLYEILNLKKTLCFRLKTQEKINEQFIQMLKLITMNKNGELTKEGLDLWESTANQQL